MKRRTLTLLAMMLALLFALQPICGMAVAEEAAQPNNTRAVLIRSADAFIDQGALSTTVRASIEGESNVTSVKIQLELQKLSDGSYSTIKTWSETFTGRSGSLEKSKLTSPLSTYRLKATVTAYASGTSESRTIYAYA